MTQATAVAPAFKPEQIDQFVRLHNISWEAYEALLAMWGENGGLRVTYLEGELEIMTPSINHEFLFGTLWHILAFLVCREAKSKT